jgi:hypothetical protein
LLQITFVFLRQLRDPQSCHVRVYAPFFRPLASSNYSVLFAITFIKKGLI